jgi:hypothetical protein
VKLGNSSNYITFKTPTSIEIKKIISIFEKQGITATIGG